jgi:hypothetical protein
MTNEECYCAEGQPKCGWCEENDSEWWTISGPALLRMLRRVAAGEDPEMVYVEAYVNSDRDFENDDW